MHKPTPANPPAVSVVVPYQGESSDRALESLQRQTRPDWEAVICGRVTGQASARLDADRRFILAADGGRKPLFASINRGIELVRGRFLTLMDPRDALAPGALESLIAAAESAGVQGARGGFEFESPLGAIPSCPAGKAEISLLGSSELALCKLFPWHAALVSRAAMDGLRMLADPAMGGDHELLIQLARKGVRWAWAPGPAGAAPGPLATVAMDAPRPLPQIERELLSHARVIHRASASASNAHVEALTLLRWFQAELASVAPPDLRALMTDRVRFPNLLAQWWQRCRYFGPPPMHVADASGSIRDGLVASPDRIARGLLDACPPDRPVVLLGLGRNARRIASLMHARGLRILGRDELQSTPPAWAREDGVEVTVLTSDAPWDPDHHYLMTLADDSAYCSRLPRGVTPLRWTQASARLLAELVDATTRDVIAKNNLVAHRSELKSAAEPEPVMAQEVGE